MRYEEFTIEGRNAVLEAFRSGKTIDRLFVQDGCRDGAVSTITREARKHDTMIQFVTCLLYTSAGSYAHRCPVRHPLPEP